MKHHTLILTLLAGALATAATSSDVRTPFAKKYDEGKGLSLTVEAICSIDPSTVSCWDTEGKPNPRKTKLVEALALTRHEALTYFFQKKNRYVLLRSKSGGLQSINVNFGYRSSFSQIFQDYDNEAGGSSLLSLCLVAVSPETKQLEVPFDVSNYESATGDLETNKGATGQVGPFHLTFAAESLAGTSYFYNPADMNTQAPTWNLSVLSKEDLSGWTVTVQPYRNGLPIDAISRKGEPVDSRKLYEEEQDRQSRQREGRTVDPQKYLRVNTLQCTVTGDGLTAPVNVNPSGIEKLHFRFTKNLPGMLTDLPADPVP